MILFSKYQRKKYSNGELMYSFVTYTCYTAMWNIMYVQTTKQSTYLLEYNYSWLVFYNMWVCLLASSYFAMVLFFDCSLLNTDVTSDAKKGNNMLWWNIIYCRFTKYNFFYYIATLFNNSCCDGMTIKDTHLVSTKS